LRYAGICYLAYVHGLGLARYNNSLRYVFSRQVPSTPRILLIESGSRGVLEKLLPILPRAFGDVEVDIVTCFSGQPKGFSGTLFNIHEYGGSAGRGRLFAELTLRNYKLAGLLSTGEPIMTKWKWWLACKLPSKIFIINENSDFFLFDWSHFGVAKNFALYRAGLGGAAALPTFARLLVLPLSAAFLFAYAGTVHLRRFIRLL
jgi:hypothetical protein